MQKSFRLNHQADHDLNFFAVCLKSAAFEDLELVGALV